MNMYKSTRAYTSKSEQYYIQQFACVRSMPDDVMHSPFHCFAPSPVRRDALVLGGTVLWNCEFIESTSVITGVEAQEHSRRIRNLLKYSRNNALAAAEMLRVSFGLVLVSSSNTMQKLVEKMSVPQLGHCLEKRLMFRLV